MVLIFLMICHHILKEIHDKMVSERICALKQAISYKLLFLVSSSQYYKFP